MRGEGSFFTRCRCARTYCGVVYDDTMEGDEMSALRPCAKLSSGRGG